MAGAALGRCTESCGLASYPTRLRHERPCCWSAVFGSMHTPGFGGVAQNSVLGTFFFLVLGTLCPTFENISFWY